MEPASGQETDKQTQPENDKQTQPQIDEQTQPQVDKPTQPQGWKDATQPPGWKDARICANIFGQRTRPRSAYRSKDFPMPAATASDRSSATEADAQLPEALPPDECTGKIKGVADVLDQLTSKLQSRHAETETSKMQSRHAEALRAELESKPARALKKRAEVSGVSTAKVTEAMQAGHPKAALVGLIVTAEVGNAAVESVADAGLESITGEKHTGEMSHKCVDTSTADPETKPQEVLKNVWTHPPAVPAEALPPEERNSPGVEIAGDALAGLSGILGTMPEEDTGGESTGVEYKGASNSGPDLLGGGRKGSWACAQLQLCSSSCSKACENGEFIIKGCPIPSDCPIFPAGRAWRAPNLFPPILAARCTSPLPTPRARS